MDYAYDNSKPGTQIKVRATDISYVSYYYKGQYTCPFCGESVRFYKGDIQKSHFRHERGSIIAQMCELYVENTSQFSDDELRKKISGIPFYIKQIGDFFQLYLGLWPVDESILAEEKRIGQKITIKDEKKILVVVIDLASVYANEIYRLPISRVYDSYELCYEISGTRLSEVWGKTISRIFSKGTFFRIGDTYSRSISLNGIINTDTSYYFLSQDPVTDKSFLKVEKSYSLLTNGTQKWRIYKIRFTKITRESAQYARVRHVQLLEKPPELVPLWPPNVQNNQKYIYQKTCLSNFRLNSSYEYGKWEISILNKFKKTSEKYEISLQNPVFSVEVNNNIQYISFFETENDLEMALEVQDNKMVTPYKQPSLEPKWMKKKIVLGSELQAIKNEELSIKSDMKCDIIRVRNHIPDIIFRDKLSLLSFPDLCNGDTIIFRHGLDILPSLYFRKNKNVTDDKHDNKLSDEVLYHKLLQLRGTFITAPPQLKYIATGFDNYPKTREYLKKAFKTGKISKQAADYLLKKHGQGEV